MWYDISQKNPLFLQAPIAFPDSCSVFIYNIYERAGKTKILLGNARGNGSGSYITFYFNLVTCLIRYEISTHEIKLAPLKISFYLLNLIPWADTEITGNQRSLGNPLLIMLLLPAGQRCQFLGTKATFQSPLGWHRERMVLLGRCTQGTNWDFGKECALFGGRTLKPGHSWMFKVNGQHRVELKVQQLPSIPGK